MVMLNLYLSIFVLMAGFTIDTEKTIHAALYVLGQIGEADYHKVFKILYFAEQYHLKSYGLPLSGDAYQAMQYGPVPSFLYDVFKAAEKGSSPFAEAVKMSSSFSVRRLGNKPLVAPIAEANMDELSETDVEALDASIHENAHLNFEELVRKSHDSAWDKAEKNEDSEISYLDMAEAVGSSEEMRSFIAMQSENAGIRF